ncbi:RHS repeat domain-containing protein [Sphingobacterium thalpophilum]|uniref:RHS repeat-associated core domain n=1 Tax=Sphingobacterium thalpophilum TaxID=259 RepID=A0A4U9W2G4_9SPHI|nr:RHS repeat-associated core domain-containing protein [Sphingobacterium thalpophilum]VTR52831.1 RHS repeat-associated core domain [Sphingobacterium thalpophilum]
MVKRPCWTFNNYIYSYKYDGRRRLVEKKIPGKGWEYLVYNRNDQVVLTQDAEQRARKEWTYTRYDAFGRITSSGLYTNTAKVSRADVSGLVDASTGPLWETRSGADYPSPATTFPLAGTGITIKPLVVNYYDDYSFTGAADLPDSGISRSQMIRSLQTGSRVYRTDGTQPLLTVMYYDDYGRVIQTASKNHLEGKDYVTNTYLFSGELKTSTRVHTPKTGTATTIVTSNEYDHVGRLVSAKERIGSQAEVTLASNSYNEIGQLKTRYMGKAGTEPGYVDTTSYTYNERGWLTGSISPRFSQQLKYQDGPTPQWNGNISQQLWNENSRLDATAQSFTYVYDKLNRLRSGTNGLTGTAEMAEVISYDDLGMGNIKTLKRDAQAVTTYTYDGNKLTGLSGGLKGSYTYDANGNAKTDRLGMAFTYNHLNLPQTAKKTGTDVSFLYDATGTKLQKVSKIGTTTPIITKRDYVDGIEYNSGTIDIIHNAVGYAMWNGTNYVYHYNLKDHLGSVRATLKRRTNSTSVVDVVQPDNYYPFGKRRVVLGGNNRYLYNGKEIQGELGETYDYGARFYDAEIGRWNVVDPMAEDYAHWSPYNYAMNSPLVYIDPDGMSSEGFYTRYVRPDGSTIVNTNDGRNDVVIVPTNRMADFMHNLNETEKSPQYSIHSIGWNNYWRGEFGISISENTLNYAGHYLLGTEESRAAQVKYFVTGKSGDYRDFVRTRIFASWSGPVHVTFNIVTGAQLYSGLVAVPGLRAAYEAEVKALSNLANEMRLAGKSNEEIARTVSRMRREIGVKYKELTPAQLRNEIYERNTKKYGDPLGPSIDYLRQQGKSWDDIINSASRFWGKDMNFRK